MRSEGNDAVVDCEDPMTVIACTTDTDACPAKCRESDEPVVVRAGDLAVTAKAAEGRKVRVPGVSDLDTLTFRASEKVTINKVVLERYGYSDSDLVDEVRLEDQDGNVIAEGKGLSKDKATLSIKKDYRDTDGTLKATVVVRTTGDKIGGTLGFKVVDVDSTAKNLNLDDYTPYTYDTVQYSGADVTVEIKGSQKNYNYEEGESYEIARLKVSAGKSIIYVKGFTLTNAGKLDMEDFLDKLTVKVDGEEVDGLKYSINKDDQLVISFDEMTIDMNKNLLFVISASLADFDDYGDDVAYYVKDDSDINATEKKTGARLTVTRKGTAVSHAFNGGKIKLANTKLGKIDAAQGSEGVLVAEGTVTVTEPISKIAFTLNANNAYVSAIRMFVNGDEFEGKNNKDGTFSFSNVEIEKSGKIQFKIDIEDVDSATGTFTITGNFNKDVLSGARYDNSRDSVKGGDVAGAISFSEVTIQSARATLKNSLSDDVEFMLNETSDPELVFDGTYTAKKALVNLNKFYIGGTPAQAFDHDVTYYLSVEGREVASTDSYGSGNEEIFNDIEVKAGESVKVQVRAVVEAYGTYKGTMSGLTLVLGGTDEFDKDVKEASAKLMGLKLVEKGSVDVETSSASKTVLYKAKNKTLAEFTVRPADGSSSVEIENISFDLTWKSGDEEVTSDDVSVMLGNDDLEADSEDSFIYSDINTTIKDKVAVKVVLNEKKAGTYTINNIKVNNKKVTKEYVTRFERALVSIVSATNLKGGSTEFGFKVEKDSGLTVKNVRLVLESGATSDGAILEADNTSTMIVRNSTNTDKLVTEILFDVCEDTEEDADVTYACPANDTENGITYAEADDFATSHKCVKTTKATENVAATATTVEDTTTYACPANDTENGITYAEADDFATSHECVKTTTITTNVDANPSSSSSSCETDISITKELYPDFFKKDGRFIYAYANSTNN